MNNNKNEQHLSAAELAGLPGLPGSVFGVQKRAAKEGWPKRARSGRGGGSEYPLSCLPVEAQAALAERILKAGPVDTSVAAASSANDAADVRAESLAAMFEAKPEKAKAEARARLAIVQEYHQLLGRGFSRAQVESAVTREREISTATLWRYLALVRGKAEHLWLYELCPAHVGRTATADMSAEAWEFLKADYLRAERPTAGACIFRLRRAAMKHGWTIPSERTMLRRLEKLPRAVKVVAREGKKAALNLYPAQQRSRAALYALAIVNGDGYKHNVWTVFPDGEIGRAKTWFWQDVYSSKILAWVTDKTEHTDIIRLSFGDVVERFGIPEAVLLDNTLAAANKTMSGGIRTRYRFRVRDEEPAGIFPLLNVNVHWATPGHGQAKPVERVFGVGGIGELVDKAPELSGAWTGSGTGDKPEYSEGKRGPQKYVTLEQLEAVIAREVAAFNAKAGRRSPMHQGRSFDEVFNESYEKAAPRRATETQRRLWLLATEPVTVKKDGTITLEAGRISRTEAMPTQANRYWHADMVDYAGRQVVARFDPRELHAAVHVYTIDGRYICEASCIAAAGFNDQAAGREHQRARRTYIRSATEMLQAERRMGALEAAKFMPGAERIASEEPSIPAPKVVRAEFRHPIEAPRPVDLEAQRLMDEAESALAAPQRRSVLELRTDAEKHAHWLSIDTRRMSGEALDEQEELFWKSWQSSGFVKSMREAEEMAAQTLQQRGAHG